MEPGMVMHYTVPLGAAAGISDDRAIELAQRLMYSSAISATEDGGNVQMPLVMDPAGNEICALQDIVGWKGKRVLEVGSGDGRLTLRVAAFGPRSIEGVDPDASRIRKARKSLPARYSQRIAYHVGHAEKLKYKAGQFDIALFAWAL